MIDVVIPLSNLIPESVTERLRTLNFALEKFFLPQKVNVICVEQALDGKVYFLDQIVGPVKKICLDYPVFNKQWCTNVGIKAGKGDVVCIAESDMFAFDFYFASVEEWMTNHKVPWCVGWNRLLYTTKDEKEQIVNGKMPNVPLQRWVQPRVGCTEGGFTFWTRDIWTRMGGANEFFQELGGPDNELTLRGQAAGKGRWHFPQQVYHLWHPTVNKNTRPTRKRNKALYRITKKSPMAVCQWLRAHQQGQPDKPLCAKIKWGVR